MQWQEGENFIKTCDQKMKQGTVLYFLAKRHSIGSMAKPQGKESSEGGSQCEPIQKKEKEGEREKGKGEIVPRISVAAMSSSQNRAA